jgi:hypothetical protein
MFEIFYDIATGSIKRAVLFTLQSPLMAGEGKITSLEKINVDRYKVNLTTLELEMLPESEWPVIRRR